MRNDPHVEELIYRVEIGEERWIFDPTSPVEEETDEFRMRLKDGIATFHMKKHYPSAQSAREPVEAYVRAWEIDVALQYGPKRKLHFIFKRSKIIDRDPPPPGTPVTLEGIPSEEAVGHLSGALPFLRHYPQPPRDFVASGDVRTMWSLYKGYLENRDRLMPMAYSCLTRLKFRASRTIKGKMDKRKKVETMYRVDYSVLDKLGKLINTLGDEVEVRKLTSESKLCSPTPEETKWIEEVLKRLIRRAGEYAADPQKQWPQITLAVLPPL